MTGEMWADGDGYDDFMGRWSKHAAENFVPWLDVPPTKQWLDVGCGTGQLIAVIDTLAAPTSIVGVDPSMGFIRTGLARSGSRATDFLIGDGRRLPFAANGFDTAVSGLVLNFVPEPERLIEEQIRVVRPGGTIGGYVWDATERLEFLQYFWEAAIDLDPSAGEIYDRIRSSSLQPAGLRRIADTAGLEAIRVRGINILTQFDGFADFWRPFIGAHGPAPAYAAGLSEEMRVELRERLRSSLPINADGSIGLSARAWAVRGTAPPPD